jgi:cytochrome b involved in lipid metabolism
VNTNVYNLTSWINSHPGGSRAILGMCGKDATTAFLNQHGGQKRPEQELATFFIGNYKK